MKPRFYENLTKEYSDILNALENLVKVARKDVSLDEKTIQLIQLAASAAIRSEGAVHSHARRALESGATKEEIIAVLLMLISTIGFPSVAAAISWVKDITQ